MLRSVGIRWRLAWVLLALVAVAFSARLVTGSLGGDPDAAPTRDRGRGVADQAGNEIEPLPADATLAEVIAHNIATGPVTKSARQIDWDRLWFKVGDSLERTCRDLPYPSAVLLEMEAQNCWRLRVGYGGEAWFLAGYFPGDHSRGALLAQLRDAGPREPFEGVVPLAAEAGVPVIFAVTHEVVCLATDAHQVLAFHLDRREIVPASDAPGCPPPPAYRRGDVEDVSCRAIPESQLILERLKARDCHRFAVDDRRRGYVHVFTTVDAGQDAVLVKFPTVGEIAGYETSRSVPGTNLRIASLDDTRVCLLNDRGPWAFDMTERRLVEGPFDGCPTA